MMLQYFSSRVGTFSVIKENLEQVRARKKQYVDGKRSEREFAKGEWFFFLKLQPCRQTSIALKKNLNLAAKYYGPF